PGSGLTAVPWGDSDQLEVGDTVLAIGNPYGLTRTVTAGIISAKERRAQSNAGGFQELLQTDAAMNPGNSGGPLVNVRGEIVGINSAIYGEAYRGISFAIPSRVARQAYEQIRREGRSRHGWLGVQMADLDEEEARSRKIPDSRGVVVLSVLPGSPAEKAGLRPGDVIRTWNGQVVEDSSALGVMVAQTPVGSEVPMEIYR
ncbi:MAG: trypsin-like peptidase domain-containing protein, partial [Clostridia bacterium]|nr:trypsin-like peptidase domain-containing protein [Clostridia bacterium]